jgi:hypothetical protein
MKARVETFCLNDIEDKEAYETLLNQALKDEIIVVNEKFDHDKMGRARITIWWHEELEEDL